MLVMVFETPSLQMSVTCVVSIPLVYGSDFYTACMISSADNTYIPNEKRMCLPVACLSVARGGPMGKP